MVRDLADEYRRQYEWRDWRTAFASLPPILNQTVIDLGCGVGDLVSFQNTIGWLQAPPVSGVEELWSENEAFVGGKFFVQPQGRM